MYKNKYGNEKNIRGKKKKERKIISHCLVIKCIELLSFCFDSIS